MTTSRKNLHIKLQFILVALLAFILPLSKKAIPPVIILLVLNWLMEGRFREKFANVSNWRYAALFIAFYLIHIVGLLYSSNMDFGLFDLEIKLSALLFPVIFVTTSRYTPEQVNKVFSTFLLGCIVAMIFCFGRGLYRYSDTQDINVLLYGELSFFHHPTYFAMYLCLAICVLFFYAFKRYDQLVAFQRMALKMLIPLFTVFVILLNAKTGLICLTLILAGAFAYLVLIQKKYLQGGVYFVTALILVGSLNWLAPLTFKRFQWAVKVLFEEVEPDATESTLGRLQVWPVTLELILENPLIGVGTGDIRDELERKYQEKDLEGLMESKLNAHNQYLQTFAALGLIGFLILFLGLLFPAIHSIKQHKPIYLMFILIIAINSLTESILEVQDGIIFYAFFNSLFMFLVPEDGQLQ